MRYQIAEERRDFFLVFWRTNEKGKTWRHNLRKTKMIIEAKRRKEERREKRRKKGKQKMNGKQNDNVGLQQHESPSVGEVLRPKSSSVGRVTDVKKRKRSDNVMKHRGKTSNRHNHNEGNTGESTAAAIRAEDEEIAVLEKKLGICSDDTALKMQAVQKLNREYARLEGFGDDFGEFLSGLDSIWKSSANQPQSYHEYDDDEYDDEEEQEEQEERLSDYADEPSEELVPMKEPQESTSSSSNYEEEELSDEEDDEILLKTLDGEDDDDAWSNDTEDDQEIHDDSNTEYEIIANAYSPSKGQDIYGNSVEGPVTTLKETKYIPPHLRAAHANITSSGETQTDTNQTSLMEQQQLTAVQRSLNGILNRLAESTMDTVTMQIMNLYQTQPSWKVNQCFTERLLQVCVHPTQLMTTLIPTYAATVAAVGCCSSSNSLGCHVLETVTIRFLDQQKQQLQQPNMIQSLTNNNNGDDEVECFLSNKESANIILLITYLYNFNVVHCTFLYDIFRHLVQSSFHEVNVELLLLILQHAGYQLRSDDPSAMKEMVLLVQQRHLELSCHDASTTNSPSGRRQYLLSAIADIKNNKKNNKYQQQHTEKLVRYRKFLGRMKVSSGITNSSSSSTSTTCLRVTLKDILDIPTAGRWWRVGNAWKGNSYLGGDSSETEGVPSNDISSAGSSHDNLKKTEDHRDIHVEDDVLLQLAAKYGMNTDLRRSIFCAVMGSTDCEDAFEKLMKLRNGSSGKQQHFEREMIRVLVECCGKEKSYNPFYEMLAVRLCDSKGKKFTFQKTYWDLVFKPIDSLKARKAANLAKLAVYLVKERKMSISVLKIIDVTDLCESAVLFLAVFFVNLLQSCDTDQLGKC